MDSLLAAPGCQPNRDGLHMASSRYDGRTWTTGVRQNGPPAIDIRGTRQLDIRAYIGLLRRSWMTLVALTLAGLLLSGVASAITKPIFTAETELFVAIQNSGTVQEMQQGNTFSQSRVQSYVKTVKTPLVLQPVIDRLGLQMSAQQLSSKVAATTELNTVIVGISVTDESPVQAAAIAQAVATSLMEAVEKLERPDNEGASSVALSIIRPAESPLEPSAPNVRRNLLIGLLIGLGLGICVAILRSTLDSRIRGEKDLRMVTDAPLLGAMSYDSDAVKNPLITQTSSQSPRAESFRQLRTNLQFSNITGQAQALVVTSSLPGEGKSTTATNLAIAMAQSGRSVCLVDADLRRPMVAEYLGLEGRVGLTSVLIGASTVDDVLQPWGEDNLFVMASGNIPPNPSELLGSSAMGELVKMLEESFDAVIIDAPPLLPVTDAAVLSQHVGGVVVVIGCRNVKQHDLEKSLRGLELVGARTLGVVLNWLPLKGPDAYGYGYGYYNSDATPKPGATSPVGGEGDFAHLDYKSFEGDRAKLPRRARTARAGR